jgi:hypothetical protein
VAAPARSTCKQTIFTGRLLLAAHYFPFKNANGWRIMQEVASNGKTKHGWIASLQVLLKTLYPREKSGDFVIVSGQVSCYSFSHSVLLDSGGPRIRISEINNKNGSKFIFLGFFCSFHSTDAATFKISRSSQNESSSWEI